MPSGLPLDESTFRAMLEYINDLTPRAQEHMREMLSISPTRLIMSAPEYDSGRDAIVWRSTHGFQALTPRGVVQMSAVDSVASWDGHEPEDL